MKKSGLLFNMVLLPVQKLLPLVLKYLDFLGKKKTSTAVMTSHMNFQPSLVLIHCYKPNSPYGWSPEDAISIDCRELEPWPKKKSPLGLWASSDLGIVDNLLLQLLLGQLGLQKRPTTSLQRVKTPLTSVLDMALNNLMVRLK